jgi:hypothetical protein
MFRRRRRRSAFAPRHPERRWILAGAGGLVLIGLFVFLLHQADVHAPAQHDIRVDLPNAFRDAH